MSVADVITTRPGVGDALAAVATSLRQLTVEIRNGSQSHGSGVIWSADGVVVTNAHVVSSGTPVVELWDGRVFRGRIARHDAARDLAVVRIDAVGLPAAVPAPARELKPGALVLAMGHPLGVRGALSLGVLHSTSGPAHARWLRADVRLAPGNSGGPLADAGGRILGLNTMIVDGLAYAIASPAVARFAAGDEERATLGVVVRPVLLRRRGGAIGFLVLEVAPGSGAGDVGIAVGDVLTAIQGLPFREPGALAAALEAARPGERVEVEVVRGFERITRNVALRTPPARPRAA